MIGEKPRHLPAVTISLYFMSFRYSRGSGYGSTGYHITFRPQVQQRVQRNRRMMPFTEHEVEEQEEETL
ncbi:MAG: hypothetical protein JWM56_1210 [Candidatus Peribacteria bacterium]|nr:hypothetical protein [Candidatus Peribacteria bacterium]